MAFKEIDVFLLHLLRGRGRRPEIGLPSSMVPLKRPRHAWGVSRSFNSGAMR